MNEFVKADDGRFYRRSLVTSYRERYVKADPSEGSRARRVRYIDARLGESDDSEAVTFSGSDWNRRCLVTVFAAPPGYFIVHDFDPDEGSEVDHVTVPILAWGVDVDGALHALTAEDEGDYEGSIVPALAILCPTGHVTTANRTWRTLGEYLDDQRALRNQTPA